MQSKFITVLFLSVALVVLAVSVAVRSVKRAEEARSVAECAAREEERASRMARKAESDRKAAEATARAEEARAVASSNEAVRAIAEQRTQALATVESDKLREKASLDLAAVKIRAEAARNEAEASRAKAAEAASVAKAKAAEAARAASEKARAEAGAAAAKARLAAAVEERELIERRRIDFETAERELLAFRLELEERERALRPEKTSADLTWVEDREADEIGATGTVSRLKSEVIRPEDDRSLPRPTRRLAKADRLTAERTAELEASSSNAVMRVLEDLHRRARDEERMVDAEFYARTIRLLYPQWVFKPTEKKEVSHDGRNAD